MARLLAFSIRNRAGALSDSPITIVFNDVDDDGNTAQFLKDKLSVSCVTLPRVSQQFHYVNKYTALRAPTLENSEWIVQLDADTAVINHLNPLLEHLQNPQLDFAGVPVLDCPVWRLDRIIEKYAGVPRDRIEDSAHPWFPTKYPLFNGGVTFFRARHLPLFRDEIVPLVEPIRNDMRLGGSSNPLHYLRNLWNRFIEKRQSLHSLIIPPYHSKNYADQIALPILIFKNNLNYHILPHVYNWRSPDANQGENIPIRIMHYLHARFPIDRNNLFQPDSPWIMQYRKSTNPGQNELAKLIDQYNDWLTNT